MTHPFLANVIVEPSKIKHILVADKINSRGSLSENFVKTPTFCPI